jgi:hypothetical protein
MQLMIDGVAGWVLGGGWASFGGGRLLSPRAIQAGSFPVNGLANLTGYYEIPNKTQDPLLIAHNLSNVLSTMRT